MKPQDLIIVDVFCKECQIEISLIEEFEEFGLIEIIENDGLKCIPIQHLPHLQKVIQFHNELKINKEGIEVILNLVERLSQKDVEIKYLQEKLRLYE